MEIEIKLIGAPNDMEVDPGQSNYIVDETHHVPRIGDHVAVQAGTTTHILEVARVTWYYFDDVIAIYLKWNNND